MPTEQKQFRFEIFDSENRVLFKDALWMTQDEYEALTPEQLNALEQERFNNWKDSIENPPIEEMGINDGNALS